MSLKDLQTYREDRSSAEIEYRKREIAHHINKLNDLGIVANITYIRKSTLQKVVNCVDFFGLVDKLKK